MHKLNPFEFWFSVAAAISLLTTATCTTKSNDIYKSPYDTYIKRRLVLLEKVSFDIEVIVLLCKYLEISKYDVINIHWW